MQHKHPDPARCWGEITGAAQEVGDEDGLQQAGDHQGQAEREEDIWQQDAGQTDSSWQYALVEIKLLPTTSFWEEQPATNWQAGRTLQQYIIEFLHFNTDGTRQFFRHNISQPLACKSTLHQFLFFYKIILHSVVIANGSVSRNTVTLIKILFMRFHEKKKVKLNRS